MHCLAPAWKRTNTMSQWRSIRADFMGISVHFILTKVWPQSSPACNWKKKRRPTKKRLSAAPHIDRIVVDQKKETQTKQRIPKLNDIDLEVEPSFSTSQQETASRGGILLSPQHTSGPDCRFQKEHNSKAPFWDFIGPSLFHQFCRVRHFLPYPSFQTVPVFRAQKGHFL